MSTHTHPTATHEALASVTTIPRDNDGPVFNAPWEAEVFAMTLTLYEQGLFTWPEWADALHQQIHRAQVAGDPDLGDTYYQHWLAALESIVVSCGVAEKGQLEKLYNDWNQAARNTPHGQPIELVDR